MIGKIVTYVCSDLEVENKNSGMPTATAIVVAVAESGAATLRIFWNGPEIAWQTNVFEGTEKGQFFIQ